MPSSNGWKQKTNVKFWKQLEGKGRLYTKDER